MAQDLFEVALDLLQVFGFHVDFVFDGFDFFLPGPLELV